jgi:DsbC/DsbD-like thiol-disulfide interchange protein
MSTYNSDNGAAEAVRKAFAALPFEQKITTLIKVELDMLGDAVSSVMSAASKAADEISKAFTEATRADEPTASSGTTS